MADEDLLDSLDGGDAKPPAKKKLKLPSGGGGLGANLVPILIGVVLVMNILILMKAGSAGGNKENDAVLVAIQEKMDQFNKNQSKIIEKLNKPETKLEGISVPTFALAKEDVNVYLNKGTPLTMNVGKSAFARTKVLVVIDGGTLPKDGDHGEGGGDGHAAPADDGHGGGGGAAKEEFGASPGPWFNTYSANFEQEVQEFFSQVEYSEGNYTVGGKTLRQPQLRQVLLERINSALMRSSGEDKVQLKDILFEEFIIQKSS